MNSRCFPRSGPGSFFYGFLGAGAGLAMAAAAVAAPSDDLKSEDAAVRKQAVQRLGAESGKEAAADLVAALDDEEASVRAAAAKSLGMRRDSEAVDGLIRTLGDDDDHNVRFYAAYALGEIKDPAAVAALTDTLDDKEWLVRDQAAWALREIREEKSIGGLIAALRADGDFERITWILKGFDFAVVSPHLGELMKGEKRESRLLGIRVLNEFPSAVDTDEFVFGALDDLDPEVRVAAISALRGREVKDFKKTLNQLRRQETDPTVCGVIETALQELTVQLKLVGHWSFDDRSETVAKDVTGGGSDGEMKGGMPVEGKVGAGLRLGGGHHIELGKPVSLPIGGQPFTVAAWVKTEAGNGVVVARGGAACGFSLHIIDGKPGFGIRRSEDEDPFLVAAKESVSGDWTHLAGSVDESGISLFVNGKLAASAKTSGLMIGNCGQSMEIGIDLSNSSVDVMAPFEGIIDEVRMYHSALTEEDLAELVLAEGK